MQGRNRWQFYKLRLMDDSLHSPIAQLALPCSQLWALYQSIRRGICHACQGLECIARRH